ncbi:von Willebrand factor A domain-containing protein 5A-like [Daphnia pulex]|uniref:von Willebrand factor A domain-containing protein 5A-like n=1 Tax=Daphnia pulex TaxID=6669 RepID=UPI001EE11202|nr:von Willebrand factor A domain-containing protein 5A-like [Daphnia pulex]
MSRCGLLIECADREHIQLPLTGVSVVAEIIDLVAKVSIEQRYVNRENHPIEAIYLFPVDEGAGVCHFTAEVDGRSIEGVVKETEEARNDYDQAIQSGHSAFLVEEKLPDVFKAKVGNLAAGSGAKIRLTYVTELKVEGDEIQFYLPTTIAPRYVPPTDLSSATAELASINYTQTNQYQVEINVTVQTASIIKKIYSPTHKIDVNHNVGDNPMKAKLQLFEKVSCMDRDFVIYVEVAEPHQPRLIHEKSKNGTSALMLSLVPSFKLDEMKIEAIFVVDRSGSMQGPGIVEAKRALKLFLHSLPIDCCVNIVGFGSTYKPLFSSSRKYGHECLALTKECAQFLEADLGGTEIYDPLAWIFEQPTINGYSRQVFVLTDGEVSNVNKVISLVRCQRGNARVFALGLGSSACHYLVEGIARAGNGTALFASLEERLEKKVMQQLQDALQPALTDIRINWQGYDETEQLSPPFNPPIQTEKTLMGYGKSREKPVTPAISENPEMKLRQAPSDKMIPPVFDGRHFIVYALIAQGAHIPEWVEVVASAPVGPLLLKVNRTKPNFEESQLIHRLAAKKLIQVLQERGDDLKNKNEIIQLGCQYGLASRYTSYVAVDPKEQKELKDSWMVMKSRDIPVQVAHGWGGLSQNFMMTDSANLITKPRVERCLLLGDGSSTESPTFMTFSSPLEGRPVSTGHHTNTFETLPHSALLSDDDKCILLISTQNYDGSFPMEHELAQLLHTKLEIIKQAGEKCCYSETVWATATALAYLSLALPKLKDSWKLAAKKAEKWIDSHEGFSNREHRKSCIEEAYQFVRSRLFL